MKAEIRASTLKVMIAEKVSQFTSRDIQQIYNRIMHDTIDWHEFSDYLDDLHTKDLLKVVGFDLSGMTVYTWSK